MKKRDFFAALALAALTLILTACSNDSGSDEPKPDPVETWSEPIELSQVDGTWKGSTTLPAQTAQDALDMTDDEWSDEMEALFADIKVTTTIDVLFTITASSATALGNAKLIQVYSSSNAPAMTAAWLFISTLFGTVSVPGVTLDNAKHSMTTETPLPERPITLKEMDGAQISSSGNKLKVPAGVLDKDAPEMILNKQ